MSSENTCKLVSGGLKTKYRVAYLQVEQVVPAPVQHALWPRLLAQGVSGESHRGRGHHAGRELEEVVRHQGQLVQVLRGEVIIGDSGKMIDRAEFGLIQPIQLWNQLINILG